MIWNTGGVRLSNVDFVGDGLPVNAASGICLAADSGRHMLYYGVTVQDVDVSGYGCAGLAIGSRGSDGFSEVRVENATLHHNGYAGLFTWGGKSYSHRNICIQRTTGGLQPRYPRTIAPIGSWHPLGAWHAA